MPEIKNGGRSEVDTRRMARVPKHKVRQFAPAAAEAVNLKKQPTEYRWAQELPKTGNEGHTSRGRPRLWDCVFTIR